MKRWNIFARELEDILVSRGLRLGQLDDRAGIHREKVRRLRISLLSPKSFPVLNPAEMEDVAEAFHFKLYEVLHLRAAALAAAIEALLMDRIDSESALLVTEQILHMLSRALRDNPNRVSALNAIRGEQDGSSDPTDFERACEGALQAIDRATRFMYFEMNAAEHRIYSQQAQLHFEVALALLQQAPDEIKAGEDWQMWHNEVLNGLNKIKLDLK
jgi:hypothetical protein